MRTTATALILTLLSVILVLAWPAVLPVRAITAPPYIFINNNAQFTPSNGVTAGNGSASNPYVIEGWSFTSASYPQGAIELYGTTAHVIIRNIHINNTGSCSTIDGIYLGHASNVEVVNSTLDSNNDGILIDNGSTNITIAHNKIIHNCLGIEISSATNLNIINNTITNNGYGSSVYTHPAYDLDFANNNLASVGGAQFVGGNTKISDNAFINLGNQGLLVQGNNFTVTGNSASNNQDGIEIYATNSLVVNNTVYSNTQGMVIEGSDNTIVDNYAQSNSGNGILVQTGNTNSITSNYLSRNGAGIALNSAPNSTVARNNLYRDGTGLSITSSNRTLALQQQLPLQHQPDLHH